VRVGDRELCTFADGPHFERERPAAVDVEWPAGIIASAEQRPTQRKHRSIAARGDVAVATFVAAEQLRFNWLCLLHALCAY